MSVEEKLDNFKLFVKEISRNDETIQDYMDMSFFKLQGLAYVLLIPQRDNLPAIAKEMQKKLDFDDEHLPKFTRYLQFFVEYLAGTAPEETLSYEERLQKVMESMN